MKWANGFEIENDDMIMNDGHELVNILISLQ